jgi:hypothetical protein
MAMVTSVSPLIGHAQLAAFGAEVVNLKREDATEHREQVNRLREKLDGYIEAHPAYDLVKMLNSGSVAKGTALSTINDMDVAVYVQAARAPAKEPELLGWLRDRLRAAYPAMRPEQFTVQTHCVRVSFRGSGLDVDVVPVLYAGAPDDRGYLIVKDTGDRVETSIPLHLEFIRRRKLAQATHFAQIVRFAKWWVCQRRKEKEDFRCKSFMVELLCAHLADNGVDFSDYFLALEQFFAYIVKTGLRERVAFSDYYSASALPKARTATIEIFDPVNPTNNVAARHSAAERNSIVEAARDSLDALNEAYHSTTSGRAVSLLKIVLGPSFRVQ